MRNSNTEVRELEMHELDQVTGGSFPPGQFSSGNPAHAPGNSNPNETRAGGVSYGWYDLWSDMTG